MQDWVADGCWRGPKWVEPWGGRRQLAPSLEAGQVEEPGQCAGHSWREPWSFLLKDGHSQCQGLLWARHRARPEIPGPSLCGNPREGDTFSHRRRQPCLWTETQKVLPKPQAEVFGGRGAEGRRLGEAI